MNQAPKCDHTKKRKIKGKMRTITNYRQLPDGNLQCRSCGYIIKQLSKKERRKIISDIYDVSKI